MLTLISWVPAQWIQGGRRTPQKKKFLRQVLHPKKFRNIKIICIDNLCLKDCYEVVLLSLRVSIGLVTANNVFFGSRIVEYNTRLRHTRCDSEIC